jgi:hypothetical protein
MAQPSFRVDDSVDNFVESRLIAGQAKSVWYRYAVESIMQCDPILDDIYDRYEYEKRQEFIEVAVKEKVDEVKQSADKQP